MLREPQIGGHLHKKNWHIKNPIKIGQFGAWCKRKVREKIKHKTLTIF